MLGLLACAGIRAAVPLPSDDPAFTEKEIAQGYRDGAVIAKPRAGQDDALVDTAEQREGRKMQHKFSRLGSTRMLAPATGETTEDAIARLKATGRYEFVEPDRIIRARVVPNDPSLSQQWGLANTGQAGGKAGADIGAASAWESLHDAPNVVVAIIDSGMRLTHTDLAANVWTNPTPASTGYVNDLHGINGTVAKTNTNSGNPTDANGHGTHVAGIIGAVGNNGTGISGVAWKVQLMPLRFLTAAGSGTTSASLACIDYALSHGAAIINASYGSSVYSAAEFAALSAARDAGVIVVAAAGNDSANTDVVNDYPAAYPLDNIVTVAATDRTDVLASYSNYGAGSVDLAAPGDAILSTYYSSDTSFQTFSGTSMATPHVTGALALLKARFPGDNYRQLINRLLRGTSTVAALRGKVQSGGRLNLASALASTSSAPFNDDFANAGVLEGANVRVRSSNAGASSEAGEPAHGGVAGGATLWWQWTAPESGTVTVDATGSGFGASLAVYSGSSLTSLQSVAAGPARVEMAAAAGVTYRIAVTGAAGATGLVSFKLGTIPRNDAFAAAETLVGNNARVTAVNVNASRETGEPTIAGATGTHSLWYRWTAPDSGRFMLGAYSLEVNTFAAVYTGSALSSLTLVASNNNASSLNSDALVGFTANAGTTYFFQVDSTGATGGNVVVTLTDALWQYATGDEITSSPAVGADGTVYVGSADGYLYALTSDGALRWRAATGAGIELGAPAVGSDGTVYVGSNDGYLYAFNGTTGARRWRYAAASEVYSAPAIAADGTIYFRDDVALRALAGGTTSATLKWSLPLEGATYSSPIIAADGTIYVGAAGGAFYAVNPNGTLKWRFAADGDIYTSPAIAADGTVYFATVNGLVYAVQPSGAMKWSWQLQARDSSITSSPAIATDGTIYLAGYDGKLHALRADGSEKWSVAVGNEVRASSPAVAADGTIYVGSYDGNVYAVKADGAILRQYATGTIVRSSPLLANNRLYFGGSDAKVYAFSIGQAAMASSWPMYHQNSARTGRIAAPSIVTQPLSQTVAVGGTLTLSAATDGGSAVSYQWYKDGALLPGATGSTYSLANVGTAAAGTYTVVITSGAGAVTSSGAVVAVGATVASKLVNLSVRASANSAAQTLIVGFSANATKPLLIRGVGPTLSAYGVSNPLSDPTVTLFAANGTPVGSNDDWSDAGLSTVFTRVGAFPLASASKDAALEQSLPAGSYTAHITGTLSDTGSVLAEVYDASPGEAGELVNLSARAQVTASEPLIAGFVIGGNTPKQVLIRATGPALAAFGVTGALGNPKLTLYREQTAIATNDDWGASTNVTEIVSAAQRVGAFSLAAGSSDSALVLTLEAGAYTAHITSAAAAGGVALVELYSLP